MKINTIASLVFVLIAMSWSCSQDAAKETENTPAKATQKDEPARMPEKKIAQPVEVEAASETDAAGEPDEFGRMPGEEHYGHSHGPEGDKPAAQPNAGQGAPFAKDAPPASGPDKYGRMPGEEHYGHDHE